MKKFLIPQLDGYPEQGILQFYIAHASQFGLNPSNQRLQDNFRIVFHESPDVRTVQKTLSASDSMPVPWEGNEAYSPFSSNRKGVNSDICMRLHFQRSFEFTNIPIQFCQDHPEVAAALKQYIHAVREDKWNNTYEFHQIGGFPLLRQDYPSDLMVEGEEAYQLLLQIDSDSSNDIISMEWGDAGLCHFFIQPSALRACNFSNVLYNWDCC